MTSTLTLRVAADSWNGDPQFNVFVDGTQVGGTLTASASHAQGQWQDITVTGAFSANPSSVSIAFINDAYGGWNEDRNLYVQSLTLGGTTLSATSATNSGGSISGGVANVFSNGTVTFNTTGLPSAATPAVAATPIVTTPTQPSAATSTLTLRVAADSWNGDPQFTVTVDGQRVAGTFSTSAQHAQGQWQDITVTGAFSATPKTVSVAFVNDAYGGWNQDRNLYIQSLTVNGQTYSAAAATNSGGTITNGVANVFSNGTVAFNTASAAGTTPATTTTTPASTAATTVTPAAASNTLVIRVAADSWNGDPQFTVSVDGKQIGGTYTTAASHAAGQWQDVSVTGAFAANPSTVSISFVNDAWNGGSLDRNLYVQSLTIAGVTLSAASATNSGGSITNGVANVMSNGTVTFNTAALATTAAATTTTTPVATTTPATTAVPATTPAVTTTSAPATTTPAVTTNSLVVRVGADSWNGDPQFTVAVDGKQVAGTFSTSASHAAGQWQDVTVTGPFAASPASVSITFINDAYGGWNEDRNLYVQGVTVNGNTISASGATDTGGSVANGVATLLSNGTVTIDTATTTAATSTSAATTAGAGTTSTAVAAVATAAVTPTTSSSGLQLLGVNLAGAEFGPQNDPGTYGTDYTYPTHQEIDYYASKGLNVIRLPFLWERLQNSENGPLNQAELARITDVVNYATSKNMKVILDPHDYGSGFGQPIGSAGTPNSAFANFWGQLASSFSNNPNVIFGLMNEPHVQSATDWLQSANTAIAAIRGAGAHQEILVPGAYYDTAATWTSSDNASVVGTGVKDPDNNYAFEVHQYLDADYSGTHAGVASDAVGVQDLTSITNWAESTGAKLFLGEFGVSPDPTSLSAMNNMLTYMQNHSNVWQGGTYWAGGPWWYGSNIYGIEPTGLGTSKVTDQPQMAVLTSHLGTSTS